MKIIDRKHLCTFITLQDQKIMKFLCLVLNIWPRLYLQINHISSPFGCIFTMLLFWIAIYSSQTLTGLYIVWAKCIQVCSEMAWKQVRQTGVNWPADFSLYGVCLQGIFKYFLFRKKTYFQCQGRTLGYFVFQDSKQWKFSHNSSLVS